MDTLYFDGKTVLVTGGTGTFGNAFVVKLLRDTKAKRIVIFSRDEFKQSQMQRDISDPERRLRFFLGDVRDTSRLGRAFENIDIVVHAAALKQVPALEYNPLEAIKTNILGTQNVIDAALDNNVENVFLISSDKAGHPINLYGATKLCAEKLFVAANVYRGEHRRTKLSVARYGNVLGSRGSLLEIISRQRPQGVVTLTDERMTRFWITVDRVMGIILESITCMRGGEIFVPKMQSLRVFDVIKTLAPDCKIKVIGIRPGEKLHEILITEHEAPRTKDIGNMFVIQPEFDWGSHEWLRDKASLPHNFVYASNNPDFLLSKEEAGRILTV